MISGRRAYHRHLPHYQSDQRTYHVAFATKDRWHLPPDARTIVLRHIVTEHEWRAFLHGAVVMPDHVHVLLTPMVNSAGETYALCEISRGIKGTSAREINRLLDRCGTVWQKESFDHELRSDESIRKTAEYICQNPVRKGLCATPDEYRWIWREWIEDRT